MFASRPWFYSPPPKKKNVPSSQTVGLTWYVFFFRLVFFLLALVLVDVIAVRRSPIFTVSKSPKFFCVYLVVVFVGLCVGVGVVIR